MSRLRLYAVVSAGTAERIEAAADRLPARQIRTIRGLDLAAVVGPAPVPGFFGPSRKEIANQILEFQRVLEALMPFGPVLPGAFDAIFDNDTAPLAFLVAHAATLRNALVQFGDKRQYQITVRWDAKAMLSRLAGTSRLARLATLDRAKDPMGYAAALGAIMEEYRGELARSYAGILAEVAMDTLILPPEGEDGIANVTVLIDPARQSILDAAVEAIDATASDALRIKMVGPLPACSFASLRLEKPDAAKVAAARRILDTSPMTRPDAVKRAYRDRMRQVHPDVAAGKESEAASTSEAYDLLRRISEAEAALVAQGLGLPPILPLVRVSRADQAGIAA